MVQQPTRPSTTVSGSADYPRAPSCSLSSVGLAPGQSRSCQFTATAVGGWDFDDSAGGAGFDRPQATLTVRHAGKTRTYRSDGFSTCADAVIRRGDRVRLTLIAPTMEVSLTYRAGAGRGWDCAHTG